METITQKFIVVIAVLGLLHLMTKGIGFLGVATFLLYLAITLVTRYPKVAITDPFILTDCTELFVFLTAINLGYPFAVAMLFLGVWIPAAIEIRLESPMDSADRTLSIFIALALFAILMRFGVSLLVAISIGLFVSSLIWSLIAFFVFHMTNPSYFVVAFAKPVVFYRILKSLGIG